jgi:hypothetical protein
VKSEQLWYSIANDLVIGDRELRVAPIMYGCKLQAKSKQAVDF